MEYLAKYKTQIGILTVTASADAVTGVFLSEKDGISHASALTDRTAEQIREFLDGKRRAFDLPVLADGTPFQQSVWRSLQKIPYGQTRSYAQIAAQIGRPAAVRAVGNACGANPVLLLIPCHRVVAKHGIGGFSSGISLKERLLALEQGS